VKALPNASGFRRAAAPRAVILERVFSTKGDRRALALLVRSACLPSGSFCAAASSYQGLFAYSAPSMEASRAPQTAQRSV
jgi:hypothetical protein